VPLKHLGYILNRQVQIRISIVHLTDPVRGTWLY